jgi:polar amino acid transport system substrate-binding protein
MRASISSVCIVGIAEARLMSMLLMNRLRTIGAGVVTGLTLATIIVCGADQAQSANQFISEKELIIGIKEAPPFVMKRSDGTLYGISIDLWRRVAEQLHLRYHFSEQETIQGLLKGTEEGSLDAAIAALTATAARERVVDFTQPFYSTGLGVAVPASENEWTSVLRTILSFGFFQAVLALLGIAICVGFVIWLLERNKTEHFGGGMKGLGTGVWWSTMAMTRGGAAQNAPATLAGRIVATGWMIASVITFAIFTAGITSTLTKRELQGVVHGVNDLRSVRVGAPTGSTTVEYLDRLRISYRGFPNPRAGLSALQAHSIDAFVYDKPLLAWLILQDYSSTLRVLDITFDTQNYAIAMPKGSALGRILDAPLLEQTESEWWDQTLYQYLGKRETN